MTAADISNIIITVAVTQLLCDLIANWTIFRKDRYQRTVSALERAQSKLEREKIAIGKEAATAEEPATKATNTHQTSTAKKAGSGKAEKLAKRLKRVEDEHSEALASVSRHHILPNMLTSLMFVVLLRILGAEHKGNVLGVLPFTPFPFARRITARGLDFGSVHFEGTTPAVTDISQACSFMFIYFLCGFSVKYYVHKLFGTNPPKGAEGIMSLVESPAGQRMMRSLGLDPNDLKTE